MSEPALIGEVVVSSEARLKVRVGQRGGRELVDLRLFHQGEGVGVFDQSTKQGFALPRRSVPALIKLLQAAAPRPTMR